MPRPAPGDYAGIFRGTAFLWRRGKYSCKRPRRVDSTRIIPRDKLDSRVLDNAPLFSLSFPPADRPFIAADALFGNAVARVLVQTIPPWSIRVLRCKIRRDAMISIRYSYSGCREERPSRGWRRLNVASGPSYVFNRNLQKRGSEDRTQRIGRMCDWPKK